MSVHDNAACESQSHLTLYCHAHSPQLIEFLLGVLVCELRHVEPASAATLASYKQLLPICQCCRHCSRRGGKSPSLSLQKQHREKNCKLWAILAPDRCTWLLVPLVVLHLDIDPEKREERWEGG